MKTLVYLFGNRKSEAWAGITFAILLALSMAWGGWLSAAPDKWEDVNWKQVATLIVITIGAAAQAAQSYMSKKWNQSTEEPKEPQK